MVQNGSKMGHFWPPNLQGEPCKWLKKGSKSGQKGVKNDPFLTTFGSLWDRLLTGFGQTSAMVPTISTILGQGWDPTDQVVKKGVKKGVQNGDPFLSPG